MLQTTYADFNNQILKEICETLKFIAMGHFNDADQLHYFKVLFLTFMNQKLEVNLADLFPNKKSISDIVEQLFILFKIEFYPDKYIKVFEEMFDLDSVTDILQLQEIVCNIEQRRDNNSTDETQKDAVILVNKVLTQ